MWGKWSGGGGGAGGNILLGNILRGECPGGPGGPGRPGGPGGHQLSLAPNNTRTVSARIGV